MKSTNLMFCLLGFLATGCILANSAWAADTPGLVIDTPGQHTVSNISVVSTSGLVTSSTAVATLTPDAHISVENPSNGDAVGVIALEQSTVVFPPTAGAIGGGLTRVDILERSIGDGVALRSDDQATIHFRGRAYLDSASNGDTIFAHGLGDSQLFLDGFVEATQSGNGSTIGLSLSGNSQATWTGSFDFTEEGNGETLLASTSGSARATLRGAALLESNGNGDTYGLRTRGQSKVSYQSDVTLRSSIYRDAVLLDMAHASQVVFDGRLVAPAAGDFNVGNRDVPPIRVADDAQLRLLGGEMVFAAARGRPVTPSFPTGVEVSDVELSERASLHWSGGVMEVSSFGATVAPTFLVEDASTLMIAGVSFSRPRGEVLEAAGSISGVLRDGNSFTINFERDATATILLVPEPGAAWLLLWLSLLLANRRRLSAAG